MTFSKDNAFSFTTSSSSSFLTFKDALSLPLTCTPISISSSLILDSSYIGQVLSQIGLPNLCISFNSSVICGAIGFNKVSNNL